MRRITPALSVLLAVALVVVSMPAARAAPPPPRAGGTVNPVIFLDDNPAVEIAIAWEGALGGSDWAADLGGDLNLFVLPPDEYLRPGTGGSYDFALENIYGGPFDYTFSVVEIDPAALPLAYKLKVNGAYVDFTGERYSGSLAKDAYAPFVLEWAWPYQISLPLDTIDTGFGIQSREEDRLPCDVTLRFDIQADDPEPPEPPGPKFPWWLIPLAGGAVLVATVLGGTALGGAAVTLGGLILGGAALAGTVVSGAALALSATLLGGAALGSVAFGTVAGGAAGVLTGGIAAAILPPLLAAVFRPDKATCDIPGCPHEDCSDAADDNVSADKGQKVPGYTMPPNTGDARLIPLALLVMALCAGALLLLNRRRRPVSA